MRVPRNSVRRYRYGDNLTLWGAPTHSSNSFAQGDTQGHLVFCSNLEFCMQLILLAQLVEPFDHSQHPEKLLHSLAGVVTHRIPIGYRHDPVFVGVEREDHGFLDLFPVMEVAPA